MRKKKILVTGLGTVLFIINCILAMISVMITFVGLTNISQIFTGNISFYGMARVASGSMATDYPVGTYILLKEVPIEKVEVGDDISFEVKLASGEEVNYFHRVVRKETINNEIVLTTKGTENELEDVMLTTKDNFRGICIKKSKYNIMYIWGIYNLLIILFVISSIYFYKKLLSIVG